MFFLQRALVEEVEEALLQKKEEGLVFPVSALFRVTATQTHTLVMFSITK